MPLKINSTNGSVTLTPEDGVGNVDITVPRSPIVGQDHAGELVVDSYNERYEAVTSTSNATTVDCENANSFSHTLTENTTFTFSNPPASGTAYTFSIEIIQDASASGYTVTWPAAVDWPSATAPTLTATASAKDLFVFMTRDGGTTWYGFTAGQALGQVMATKKKLLQVSGGGEDYWIALLGGSSSDTGYEISADSGNNIIVVGVTGSAGAGSNDLLTAKYDASGTLLWSKAYGNTASDSAYRVVIDSSDNIISAGAYNDLSSTEGIVVKYNSAGTLQWARSLGRSTGEVFYGVAVDSSDNIYATGYTDHGTAGYEVLVAKYNSSGTLQWQRKMGASSNDYGRSASVDSSGNIIISGYTTSFGQGGTEALLVKLNSGGTILWVRSLGNTSTDAFFHATVDSSDNIIAVGRSIQDSYYETIVAKYSSSGNLLWIKALSDTGTAADYGYNVVTDSSDNICIVAFTRAYDSGFNEPIIAKFNSSGTLLMQKRLGGTNNDAGYGIGVDLNDNILVTGYTQSDGAGNNDIFVAKLPPDGSGDGTYGSLTYQDATLTVSTPGVTSSAQTITSNTASNTSSSLSVTETTLALTEELFVVTP